MNKFPKAELIKQDTESDCAAAVVAMVCALPLAKVKRELQPTVRGGIEYYRTHEVARYLATKGIIIGLHLEVRENPVSEDVNQEVPWHLRDWPAIIAVKSKRFDDADHWVLWDGSGILDPSPLASDDERLEDYEVVEIYPLTIVDDVWKPTDKSRRPGHDAQAKDAHGENAQGER